MPKTRVLLFYISEVSGHRQAALAIEGALKILGPNIETLNLNAFNYTNPITEKIVNRLYLGIIKRTPGIWDYLYDNPSVVRRTQKIKEFIHKHNFPKLKRLFDNFKPNAVVCTQAFPCGMTADFMKTHNINIPLIGVLTDYAPHFYWVYDAVDYYIVPSQEVKDMFVQKGVQAGKIKPYGIPIDVKFSFKHDKEELRRRFGLPEGSPVALIMGGGQGLGPITRIVKAFHKSLFHSELIVVTGNNTKLYRQLARSSKRRKKKISLYKYVNNIDELMEISSIVITKAGGLTTAEAVSKGLPMVIIKPIPGQEEINTTYFLEKGAAIKITDDKLVSYVIEELLTSDSMLPQMRESALKISKPHASFDIAKLIIELCSNTSSTA